MGASFDCTRAASWVETTVCKDETLSAADEEMASLYKQARDIDERLVADQLTWLQVVRNSCATEECVSSAYLDRIDELGNRIPAPESNLVLQPLEQSSLSQPSVVFITPTEPPNDVGNNTVSISSTAAAHQSWALARRIVTVVLQLGLFIGMLCLAAAIPKSDRRFTTGYKDNAEPDGKLFRLGLGLIFISGILLYFL